MLRLNFGLFILAIASQSAVSVNRKESLLQETQAANLSATSQSPDDLLAAANNQSWGMQLFAPKAFLRPRLTTKFVQLFAQHVGGAETTKGGGYAAKKAEGVDARKGSNATEKATDKAPVGNATEKARAGKPGGADAAAKAAGRAGGGGGGGRAADKLEVVRARAGGSYQTNKLWGEVTVSMPRFRQNEKGDWVYHYWGATYGKVWQDTRFGIHRARTIQRLRIDSLAMREYYPDGTLAEVCLGRTTIYNRPQVTNYLIRRHYWFGIKHRPIWEALRRQIHTQGNAEECHVKDKYPKFREFQECQIRRHMRLEYLIPKYPLHQRDHR
ncbi:uncharacterized protein LOC135434004 [Drosophila montana]|uniref:uncharacterized protein LOC135434004 n=1 Tax=Drosophila montana TaxID=40370 RepID=UPI00313C209B